MLIILGGNLHVATSTKNCQQNTLSSGNANVCIIWQKFKSCIAFSKSNDASKYALYELKSMDQVSVFRTRTNRQCGLECVAELFLNKLFRKSALHYSVQK